MFYVLRNFFKWNIFKILQNMFRALQKNFFSHKTLFCTYHTGCRGWNIWKDLKKKLGFYKTFLVVYETFLAFHKNLLLSCETLLVYEVFLVFCETVLLFYETFLVVYETFLAF